MKYKRIDLTPTHPYNKSCNPFTMCFVYPKNGENFVVTGANEQAPHRSLASKKIDEAVPAGIGKALLDSIPDEEDENE